MSFFLPLPQGNANVFFLSAHRSILKAHGEWLVAAWPGDPDNLLSLVTLTTCLA